ncbi:MAG TPA: hypothetical protein PKO06_11475 [Candidatus Ozemobacteraceae bacterium]|nr:hypothetical protein [Candidatus Ozemobacteraceae bacterium]
MFLPFGEIKENRLIVSFSSADYSVATVLNAVKERLDIFGEMKVTFLGASTEIPSGPSPVFRPVAIQAFFEYQGSGDARPALEKTYALVWESVALTFPGEAAWATAKGDFGRFISSQAELLRARTDSTKGA